MDQKRVAATTVAAVAVAFVARYTPGFLLERWTQGIADGVTTPPFGTVGEAVLVAGNVVNVVETALPLAIGVGFGLFLAGRVTNVASALRTVVKTALAVVGLVAVGGLLVGGFDPIYALALGAPTLAASLLAVVGAVAGAGAAHLDLLDGEAEETAGATTTDAGDHDQTAGTRA